MKYKWGLILGILSIFLTGCIGNGSCERFNIDSFELTAGMNVPKVKTVDCFQNDTLRISLFYLDVANDAFLERYETMAGYVDNYKMKKISGELFSNIKGHVLLPVGLDLSCSAYYEATGTTKKGNYWKYLICKEKNLLIAEMTTN